MDTAESKVKQQRELGERICSALGQEIEKLGLTAELPLPRWEGMRFSLQQDPALGEESLEGLWLSERGGKLGSLVIHHDGSFFAEYDVIRPHPRRAKWFVEAVSAWGRDASIKSEARLLPMPED